MTLLNEFHLDPLAPDSLALTPRHPGPHPHPSDANDTMFERIHTSLDEAAGIKRQADPLLLEVSQAHVSKVSLTFPPPPPPSPLTPHPSPPTPHLS